MLHELGADPGTLKVRMYKDIHEVGVVYAIADGPSDPYKARLVECKRLRHTT